jgi:hypothetical protein
MITFVEDAVSSPVDFVALDKGTWGSTTMGAQVTATAGTGDYQIEMESNIPDWDIADTWGDTMSTDEAFDAFEIFGATIGNTYTINLLVPATADLDLYLFDFLGDDAQDSDAPPWSSTNVGPGVSESITFTSTISGQYLMVITNRDGGFGGYTVVPPAACPGLTFLFDDLPVTCPTPLPDNFDFFAEFGTHTAIGIRPPSGVDYNLNVFEDSTMATFIEGSSTDDLDLVTLNKSVWGGFRGAMTSAVSGTGDYQIEMENFLVSFAFPFTSVNNMNILEVLDAYEILGATVGSPYIIDLTVPATADLDMFLFDFFGDSAQNRVQATWASTNVGPGVDESILFSGTINGEYLLVITNQNGGFGTYTIDGNAFAGNFLTVNGLPKASGNIPPGQTDVTMEQLSLSASSGTITITDIQVDQTGTGVDADTGNIDLFDDVNDNGVFDTGTDLLLDTQTFTGGTLTFTGLAKTVTSGTPENLLFVADVAAGATLGNTLEFTLASNSYITCPPDAVSSSNFPIKSNTVTISTMIDGNITGTVVDEDNNLLKDATVELYDSTDTKIETVESDAKGEFTFSGLAAVTGYYVVVIMKGYNDKSEENIAVVAGQTTDLGKIELKTNAEIKGRVLRPDNTPFVGVKVQLLDKNGNVRDTVTTDDDGWYKFEGLEYGEFSVKILAQGYNTETIGPLTIDDENLEIVNDDLKMVPAGDGPGTGGFLEDWWWLLLLIVIVVIVLVIIMLLAKRRKRPAEMPPEPGTEQYVPPGEQAGPYQPDAYQGPPPQSPPQTPPQA